MYTIVITIFFISVLGQNFCEALKTSNVLRSVVVLYRHGDRAPTALYPEDPYKNVSVYWPQGLGELTNLGIQHQYELGVWFRQRYDNFLPENFSPDDIYVRSSDRDRTLMSAAANLAGLYPPRGAEIWNRNLLWRPVPIHTVQNEDDAVLAMKRDCPRYNTLYTQVLHSPFFQKIDEENRELYKFLSNNTGWNITTIRQVETVYSLLSIEKQYNLTLPLWTRKIFPQDLEYLAALHHASYTFTNQLTRLKSGPFFDYIFAHFEQIVNNSSTVKLLMLSGHDNTIVNVLSAMNLYDYSCPEFSSTVIWELRQNGNSNYINLFYKNSTVFKKLKLSGCEENCEYNKFKDYLGHVTVDIKTWEKECLDFTNR